jgi:hypothetical protein
MRTTSTRVRAALHRTFRFDTGLAHLRATAVTMAGVLGTWAAALLVERWAGLHVDTVIQAVVIASSLGRVQRLFDRADRLLACAVLPAAAAGATELSTLIGRHPDPADVLFTLGVAGSVWVRRFGPRATRAGTVVVLPLIAVLVVGGQPVAPGGHARTAWSALLALVAVGWGSLVLGAARRAGVVGRPPSRRVTATAARKRPGPAPSTRMALQMAAALGTAFAVGRALWPTHWAWVVLTAFIVCSGARGRGDVLLKGVRRAAGAAVGTVVAGLVSGAFGPHSDAAVAVMFTVLAVATWLRELSYAYWAGCVTAMLSLLYDWFGEAPGNLLHTRLAGIAVGAVLGVAASWLVLPIRTRAVARVRIAAVAGAIGELLAADWRDHRAVRTAEQRYRYWNDQLQLSTAPLRAFPFSGPADRRDLLHAADALRECAELATHLATTVSAAPPDDPSLTHRRAELTARVGAIRRTVTPTPGVPPQDRPD